MYIRHQDLTTAEVRSSHSQLFTVCYAFFPPLSAILRRAVKSSFRMIAACRRAGGELIIIPANTPLEIINQPAANGFRPDRCYFHRRLLLALKRWWYVQDYPPANLTSLCTPMSRSLTFMWENVDAARAVVYPLGYRNIRRWGYC